MKPWRPHPRAAALALALARALALGQAVACGPTAKDIETAQVHYDLGVNAMEVSHDPQSALRELRIAEQANPGMADVHTALGLVYAQMLQRPEEAIAEYKVALKLEPTNGEAANNYGTALIDLGRYGEAAELFRRALANDLYRTPFIARGNLGWALYKQGDVAGGIANLKQAIQLNTDYCQGYRSLGMIASDQGQLDEATAQFTAYVKHCPTMAEAHLRLGMVLLKLGKPGDQDRAREQFGLCSSEGAGELATECSRLLKLMQ